MSADLARGMRTVGSGGAAIDTGEGTVYGNAFPDVLDQQSAFEQAYNAWQDSQRQQAETQPTGAEMARAKTDVQDYIAATGADTLVPRQLNEPRYAAPNVSQYGRGTYAPKPQVQQDNPVLRDLLAPVGTAIDQYINTPWKSLLGRTLIAVGGKGDEFNSLVAKSLAAKGVTNPSFIDSANEAGRLAADIWAQASGSGTPFVGGLAEAANPAWWVSGAAGAGIGKTLLQAGVSPRVAGLVQSTIANGGLPYADRALNAIFVNSFTRAVARRFGENVGDLASALHSAIPDQLSQFVGEEGGSLNVERMREILGLSRKDTSPRATIAALENIVKENDSATLRESILGPGGGYQRVATAGGGGVRGFSREGSGLTIGQGSTAVETDALRAFRAEHVDPYKGVLDDIRKTADAIDLIDRSPRLEWGSLTAEEQLRRLAINDPQGEWQVYLDALRQGPNETAQRDIIVAARQHGVNLDKIRNEGSVPFDAPLLPGDDASALLSEKAVLEAKLRDQFAKARELIANATTPTAVPRVFTYRPKMIGDRPSQRSFEITDRLGRVVGTARSEKEAAQRVHDLNVARASETPPPYEGLARPTRPSETQPREQTTLPGTPEAQPPKLTLENPTVSEADARAARGPAGEQTTLPEAQRLVPGEPPVAAGSTRVYRGESQPFPGATTAKKAGRWFTTDAAEAARYGNVSYVDVPNEELAKWGQGVVSTDIVKIQQGTAAKQYVLPAGIANTKRELPGEAVTNLRQRIESSATPPKTPLADAIAKRNAETAPTPRDNVWERFKRLNNVGADVTQPEGPRYVARGNTVYDTWKGQVDEILTGRVNQYEHSSAESAQKTAQRWAKWADGKVNDGSWNEHNISATTPPTGEAKPPEVPPAQPPSEPPKAPPSREPLFPEETPPPNEEPGQIVWRVVDQKDGTFALSQVDLSSGMVMKSERFASREGALITAEQRNAEDDAVTMAGDAMTTLRDTLEGIPPQPALMSPGQAAATREALKAERAAAQKAVEAARKEYLRLAEQKGRNEEKAAAAATLRQARERARLLQSGDYGRAGIVPEHLALPAPSGAPVTRTVEQQAAIEKGLADVRKARAKLREKLAADPGYGLANPGTAPVDVRPAGKTPIAAPGEVKVAARDALGVMESLGELHKGDILPIAQTISRILLTGFDVGTIMRNSIIVGLRHPTAFAPTIRAAFESYLRPEVVQQRALDEYARALTNGGQLLHRRTAGEYVGESVSERITTAAENAPVIGGALFRSQVSFNESLNLLAAKSFNGIVEAAAKKGKPLSQEVKDKLAWRLNHQLGYAYDAKDLTGKARWLHETASFLYAPQWQASRAAVLIDFGKAIPKVLSGKADAAELESFTSGLLFTAANVSAFAAGASALGFDFEIDPHSTNFMRIPLGPPDPKLAAIAAPLSALGVSVMTYNDTVYLDFTAGIGADFRLLAQLFPFGGDNGIISGRAVSGSGRESDPYNPKGIFDRSAQEVAIDFLSSRAGPGSAFVEALIAPQGSDKQRPAASRMASALVSSYIPMVIQDALQASGSLDSLALQERLDNLFSGGSWFSSPTPTQAPRPTIVPRTSPGASPAVGGGPTFDPRAYR